MFLFPSRGSCKLLSSRLEHFQPISWLEFSTAVSLHVDYGGGRKGGFQHMFCVFIAKGTRWYGNGR